MMLSIPAWKDTNYLSLEEILLALENSCKYLHWRLRVLEVAPEPDAVALNNVVPEMLIGYFDLLNLVKPRLQIIDGEVAAEDKSTGRYLLIRAVDSTSWDIETNDLTIMLEVKRAFPDAEEIGA